MRMQVKLFIATLFIATALGCAALGVPQPESFNDRAALALTGITAARSTSTTLLQAKKLTPDDHQNIEAAADGMRVGVTVARTLAKTNMSGAESKLTSVSTSLRALQAYLATRQ